MSGEQRKEYYIVAYDITDDRRRYRILKLMKDFGRRIQYSVYECELADEEFDRMLRRALSVIDKKEDSVVVVRLCSKCLDGIMFFGTKEIRNDYEDEDFLII